MDKIDEFYDMCRLFDDNMELTVAAIKEIANAKEKPYIIFSWCEMLNTVKLGKYIDCIMDTPINKIIVWKVGKLHRQTTIYDYIK